MHNSVTVFIKVHMRSYSVHRYSYIIFYLFDVVKLIDCIEYKSSCFSLTSISN